MIHTRICQRTFPEDPKCRSGLAKKRTLPTRSSPYIPGYFEKINNFSKECWHSAHRAMFVANMCAECGNLLMMNGASGMMIERGSSEKPFKFPIFLPIFNCPESNRAALPEPNSYKKKNSPFAQICICFFIGKKLLLTNKQGGAEYLDIYIKFKIIKSHLVKLLH